MTDPLRPFTQAIRSLWRSRVRGTRGLADAASPSHTTAADNSQEANPPAASAGETLQSRLKSRLAALNGRDPKLMRAVFVETVLIWELGDQLALDPGLAGVVARVSEQLAADAAVVERLQELLVSLTDDTSAR